MDVKGVAPLLVDFPATLNGETVLLCWLEGNTNWAGITSRSMASRAAGSSQRQVRRPARPGPRPAAYRTRRKPASDVR
ncbi:MAG TPA: DUF2203 family protein [Streptosporangiaceae bacterium]